MVKTEKAPTVEELRLIRFAEWVGTVDPDEAHLPARADRFATLEDMLADANDNDRIRIALVRDDGRTMSRFGFVTTWTAKNDDGATVEKLGWVHDKIEKGPGSFLEADHLNRAVSLMFVDAAGAVIVPIVNRAKGNKDRHIGSTALRGSSLLARPQLNSAGKLGLALRFDKAGKAFDLDIGDDEAFDS